jgi:hypothetical protein
VHRHSRTTHARAGAQAISSDAYWNRETAGGSGGGGRGGGGSGSGGPADDMSASELVNKLSVHVSGQIAI